MSHHSRKQVESECESMSGNRAYVQTPPHFTHSFRYLIAGTDHPNNTAMTPLERPAWLNKRMRMRSPLPPCPMPMQMMGSEEQGDHQGESTLHSADISDSPVLNWDAARIYSQQDGGDRECDYRDDGSVMLCSPLMMRNGPEVIEID